MSDQPNPSSVNQPHPAINRDVAHAVVAGMGIVRKPLFAAPISQEGWQKMMLTHIAAAKALGFTMFEIDTMECTVPRPKRKKEQPQANSFFSSMWIVSLEGEEWKAKQPDDEIEETDGTMRTTMVRVFALAVE